jgi:hypothetical protein
MPADYCWSIVNLGVGTPSDRTRPCGGGRLCVRQRLHTARRQLGRRRRGGAGRRRRRRRRSLRGVGIVKAALRRCVPPRLTISPAAPLPRPWLRCAGAVLSRAGSDDDGLGGGESARPMIEAPWLRSTSECPRPRHPPRLNNLLSGAGPDDDGLGAMDSPPGHGAGDLTVAEEDDMNDVRGMLAGMTPPHSS